MQNSNKPKERTGLNISAPTAGGGPSLAELCAQLAPTQPSATTLAGSAKTQNGALKKANKRRDRVGLQALPPWAVIAIGILAAAVVVAAALAILLALPY